ncbi:MAG TPA: hypothetical protein VKZ49_17315 [Polyangiaceae bacterium]|nr:hypothetical protein [Polyangiaceae bacterium]
MTKRSGLRNNRLYGPALSALAGFVGLAGCDGSSFGEASSVEAPSAATTGPSRCQDSSCKHLDSECARGVCGAMGLCTTTPARDGLPCAEGGPCGEARCQAGTCVPLAPPDCSALDTACHVGRCDVAHGCELTPRRLVGSSCESRATLPELTAAPSLWADNRCGRPTAALDDCGAPAGNAVFFGLDLSTLPKPSELVLAVAAPFPVVSALLRGDCADPVTVACAEAAAWYENPGGVHLRHVVDPGAYWVAVAASDQQAAGSIQLTAGVEPLPALSAGAECDGAIPLDPDRDVQAILGPIQTASSNDAFECGVHTIRRFYELDLSERPADTLVRLELAETYGVAVLRAPAETGCGELVWCGRDFGGLLEPARYLVGVDPGGFLVPEHEVMGLRATIRPGAACDHTRGVSCSNAIELAESATRHRLRGDLACGDLPSVWWDDPRVFYRLDLSHAATPVAVRVRPGSDGSHGVRFLEAGGGECGETASLGDALLAPRPYYVGVYGPPSSYDLELELEPRPIPGPSECVPPEVIRCVQDSVPGCEHEALNTPRCVAVLEACGLDWPPLAGVCASAPECCDPSAGEAPPLDCELLFIEAGARCEVCRQEPCWF